jgi:N-acetylmuramoyl-L-alanine amidase
MECWSLISRFATILYLLCALSASAGAQEGLVDARALAGELGLSYESIGGGAIHSAKLSGKGRDILIFAEMRNIVVNGETALVARPVQWNGSSLILTQEAADLIRERVGVRPAVVAASPVVEHRSGPFRVVLDPGHGGKDPGAVGRTELREKDINLEVAIRLGRILQSRGVRVTMTRNTDVYVELDDRAEIANRARPDLFVSLHTNADERRGLRGAMTLYPDDGVGDDSGIMARALGAAAQITADFLGADGSLERGALLPAVSAAFEGNRIRSIQAARKIQDDLAPVTGRFYRDNGVIEDFRGLRVLRKVHAPAVLVEMDFLSNTYSERKLATSAYRASIAEALSKAVMEFLESSPQ